MCMGHAPDLLSKDGIVNSLFNPAANTGIDKRFYKPFTDPATDYLKKTFDPKVPTQPATQAQYAPDTNSVLRQRKIAVNTGAFGSLLPPGPSVSSGTSLLGG